MNIPLQRISQIDIDGFVAYVNAFAFGNPPERAPVTILKFLIWLQHPPCSNLSIDSEDFRHNPITSQIPRDVLHQLADVAEIDWSDALRMSVWDLVIQARGKAGEREGVDAESDGKQLKGGAKVTINARMIDTLLVKPEAKDWTAREWATHLGCAASTVTDQPMWKELAKTRVGEAFSEGSIGDRRRLPKRKN